MFPNLLTNIDKYRFVPISKKLIQSRNIKYTLIADRCDVILLAFTLCT